MSELVDAHNPITSANHYGRVRGAPILYGFPIPSGALLSFGDILLEGCCGYFQSESVPLQLFVREQNNPEIEERITASHRKFVALIFCFDNIEAKFGVNLDMRGR